MNTATKLTRDLDEAMLGGVLSGLAVQYDWDPALVRIVAVLVTLATGVVPGILLYLAAWVLIPLPERPIATTDDAAPPAAEASSSPVGALGDEMTSTLRDAADRLTEAATIATEAARQAANEIGEVARRPRGSTAPTAEEPTTEEPATEEPATPPIEDVPDALVGTDDGDQSAADTADQPDANEPERFA